MNIEAIYQNANVVSQSVSGEINRVQIDRSEYDFLVEYTNNENNYSKYADDVIELDYHGEFIPLIEQARERLYFELEQEEITTEEIQAWKAVNNMFEDEEENYYHG